MNCNGIIYYWLYMYGDGDVKMNGVVVYEYINGRIKSIKLNGMEIKF